MSKGGVRYSKERALRPAHQFPIGAIWLHAGTTPPPGCFECDGRAVSRTTYKDLFDELGTVHGAGDGSTTFNIPNLRGVFVRGWDHGRGMDNGRVFGSAQVDELKSHKHNITKAGVVTTGSGGDHTSIVVDETYSSEATAIINATNPITATGGLETRPKNVALMYVIKHTYIPGYDPEVFEANAKTLDGLPSTAFALATDVRYVADVRNTVLTSRIDGQGLPNYLQAGTVPFSVDIYASTTDPVVVTMASGYGKQGQKDYFAEFDQYITGVWQSLPANATRYLYVETDALGNLTFGHTDTPPQYEDGITLPLDLYTPDLCNNGTAISGGDYSGQPVTNAFDNNTGTNWASSQLYTSVSGNAAIGYQFTGNKKIRKVTLNQSTTGNGHVTSAKVQYSDNGSTWTDAYTATGLVTGANVILVPDVGSHLYWRLLAASNTPTSGYGWGVYELEMMELSADADYYVIGQHKMKHYASGVWSDTMRTYVGEVVTDASGVTGVTHYANRGQYNSPWFAVATGNVYTQQNNIGANYEKYRFRLMYRKNTPSPTLYVPGISADSGGNGYGANFLNIDKCTSKVATAVHYVTPQAAASSGVTTSSSGEYKLIIERGW